MKKHILFLIFTLFTTANLWSTVEVSDLNQLQNALGGTDPDILLKGVITISEETVLDLKGKTITGTQAFMFRTKGRQEITFCNGAIHAANSSSKSYAIFLLGPSTVTLRDIELTSTFAPICNNKGTKINLGENVTIHGEVYDLINMATSTSDPQIVNTGTLSLDKVLTRNKCTIINDGDLSIGTMQDSATNSKIKLINHVDATLELSDAHINRSQTTITNEGEFTLSGGEFTKALSITNSGSVSVTGGIYTIPTAFNPIQNYIAPTHKTIFTSLEDVAAYRVVPQTEYGEALYEATEYEFFTTALSKAQQSGATNPVITILKDIADCPSVVVDKAMTWNIDTCVINFSSDTDSIVVTGGTFAVKGTSGVMNTNMKIDGENASLDAEGVTLNGRVLLLKADSIVVGENATIAQGIYTDTVDMVPPVYSCRLIRREGNCNIRLTDTYIDTIVAHGSGAIALGANCYFPKSSALLRSYVASDCSALLRKDDQYGDVYKVEKGFLPVAFKVEQYEYTNTREEWNMAVAASSATTPAVLQGHFSLDADLNSSGYLDLNGYSLTITTDAGLVVRDCDFTLLDGSSSQAGTIGNNANEWTIHQKGEGKLKILGGRVLGKLEQHGGKIELYGGFYRNDPESFLAQGYQRFVLADVPASVRTAAEQDAMDAGYPYMVDVQALCHLENELVVNRRMYLSNVVVKRADTTTVINVDPQPTPYVIPLDQLTKGRYMVEQNQGEVMQVIAVQPTTIVYHDTTHVYAYMFDDEQFLFRCSTYDEAGYYVHCLTDQWGRDSLVVLHLEMRSCNIPVTDIKDTLCFSEAVEKYKQFNITGSGVYYDTLLSRVSPCDSVVAYNIHIWNKPTLPELSSYPENLMRLVCGRKMKPEALLEAVKKDVTIEKGTAQFEDIWLEVKLHAGSPFVKVTDQSLPAGIDSVQIRLVGPTICADTILVGDPICRVVQAPAPENSPELGNQPAVSKYNNWILMIDHREMVAKGYQFEPNDVTWYQVEGEIDSTYAIVDDIEVGKGYYYTADQSLTHSYYAIIMDHSSDCGAVVRTIVLTPTPAEPISLAPVSVRRGETMTLSHLAMEETTQLTIYNMNGQPIRMMQVEGVEQCQVEAEQSVGLYLMRVKNGEQEQTFRYMIIQ